MSRSQACLVYATEKNSKTLVNHYKKKFKMKRTFIYLIVLTCAITLFSCVDEYDDSFLRTEIDKINEDISSLKAQISTMQTVIDAFNEGKVITNVMEMSGGKGNKITFNDGTSIEIVNGKNAPVIGVQELNDIYYWTLTTNGNTSFLLDHNEQKLPVSGEPGEKGETPQLEIDTEGYWTLNGVRVKDSIGNVVKAKGDSFFKGIEENEESITFILTDDSTIVIAKSTGTYLRFVDESTVFIPNQTKRITFQYANLHSLEIVSQPEGWVINIHAPQKYMNVTASKEGYGAKDIKLQGIDKNGLTYQATIKVSIIGSGYTAAGGVFVLNEGNMTTENGSLIYIDPNGQVFDKVYNNENGTSLGNVTQDMFIDDDKMYINSQN